jgi:hypothetical protein
MALVGTSRTVRLVCIPSGDVAFRTFARTILAELGDRGSDEALAEFHHRLRAVYPAATVRPQERLGTLAPNSTVWYATNRAYASPIAAIVDMAAPLRLVYETYVERMPEWQARLRLRPLARADGRVTQYATAYDVFGKTFEGVFRVVEATPPHSVLMEAIGTASVRVWFAATFLPSARGTVIHVYGGYDLPSGLFQGVTKFALDHFIARDIERSHERLVALCEREARTYVPAPLQASPP